MLTKSKLRLYLLLFAVLFSLWFAVLLITSREKQLANEPLARTKAVAISRALDRYALNFDHNVDHNGNIKYRKA
jgi:hypothetical protein